MEASREFSRTPRRLPPCSDVSVLQKTRMSHFWDTHHTRSCAATCRLTRISCENGLACAHALRSTAQGAATLAAKGGWRPMDRHRV